jgi:hypothetical protein
MASFDKDTTLLLCHISESLATARMSCRHLLMCNKLCFWDTLDRILNENFLEPSGIFIAWSSKRDAM